MKTNKKALMTQRRILDQRLESWTKIADPGTPPSGWIRAVRGALGMSTRQLARLLSTTHSGVVALEKREAVGTASFEMIQKAANAMGCRLIYAIIPESPNHALEDLLNARARAVARNIMTRVEHSMRLEKQGSTKKEIDEQVEKLAAELKSTLDARLWDLPKSERKKTLE